MYSYNCELCNGNQFVKSEDGFVCQKCGVRYSVEDMKKLNLQNNSEHCDAETVQNTQKTPTKEEEETSEKDIPPEPLISTQKIKKAPLEESTTSQHPNPPQKTSTKENKTRKISRQKIIKYSILGSLALITVVCFIVFLIMACDPYSSRGNNLLIISGSIEILIAVILYKIAINILRYNCPVCAAKRVHHRRYVRTSEIDKTFNNQGGPAEKTIYKHHYVDTYVCPVCGETRTENVTKSAGEYIEYANGSVRDTRKPPREF